MWHALRKLPEGDFPGSVAELLRSTSRDLVLVTGIAYLIWHLASTVIWPDEFVMKVWFVTPVMVVTTIASLWLLGRRLVAAQAVWQLGLAATITLSLCLFREPAIGLFYVLLPLMAVVTVGWPGGVLAEGLVVGLLWGLSHHPALAGLPAAYLLVIVSGGALAGFLGWTATRSLLTVTDWSLTSSRQARDKVEEARDQRLELKQTQEDLIRANRELSRLSDRLSALNQIAEEARQAKEEFVANISHELRTPLNMIIGFSEMITQRPHTYGSRLPPALLSDITAIQRNSQHLAKLVSDVLDLSQVEAGRMALSKEWACLPELIGEAAQAVQALFDSKGLSLQLGVPSDLPSLFCDSTRIRQVVINLLSNAGRFTERGGVRITARREEAEIIVSVADTGPGIAPAAQKRVFEPFQQLDGSIRRRHGGSGLGLAISRRFIEMHGGRMWIESQVGAGSTFHFGLPLAIASHVPPPDGDVRRWFNPHQEYQPRLRRSKVPVPRLTPRLVLLETGDTLLKIFRRYADDLEIASVRDMEGALLELGRSPAQALIVNAPTLLDAPGAGARLAGLPYGTPAIACWVPGADEAGRRLGVVHYLIKPVTREQLLSTLELPGKHVRTVLLVDDDPEALQLFTRMLLSADGGYDVLQAKSGLRALSLLRQRRPDLVLLDLVMPGMDGFQVLREKSQDPDIRDIPVVIVSSKDPAGEPLSSNMLAVARGGGLSVREILECIRAISGILAPSTPSADRGSTGTPGV